MAFSEQKLVLKITDNLVLADLIVANRHVDSFYYSPDAMTNVELLRQLCVNYLTWSFIDIIHTVFVFVSVFVKMKNDARYREKWKCTFHNFTLHGIELHCLYFENFRMIVLFFFSFFKNLFEKIMWNLVEDL